MSQRYPIRGGKASIVFPVQLVSVGNVVLMPQGFPAQKIPNVSTAVAAPTSIRIFRTHFQTGRESIVLISFHASFAQAALPFFGVLHYVTAEVVSRPSQSISLAS